MVKTNQLLLLEILVFSQILICGSWWRAKKLLELNSIDSDSSL